MCVDQTELTANENELFQVDTILNQCLQKYLHYNKTSATHRQMFFTPETLIDFFNTQISSTQLPRIFEEARFILTQYLSKRPIEDRINIFLNQILSQQQVRTFYQSNQDALDNLLIECDIHPSISFNNTISDILLTIESTAWNTALEIKFEQLLCIYNNYFTN